MFALAASLLLFGHRQSGLLDEVRHALHVDKTAAPIETILEGRATVYGTQARYTFRFLPDGRFTQNFAGVLGETFVDDGKHIYKTNRDGVTRALTFEDVDEILGETLVLSDEWIDPKFGATLTTDANKVHLKLASGLKEDISIDPTTHLPTTATFELSPGPVKVAMSDWRSVGGRMYPFHARVDLTEEVRIYDVGQASTPTTVEAAAYEQPARRALDVSFDPSKSPELTVKRAPSGHMLVKPMVNGKDIGWFIVDSGAESMCIDPKVADKLGLSRVGTLSVTGVGGTVKGSFRPVDVFTLGPATMRHVYFVEIDLAQISQYFQVPIAGVVGDEYFDRSIVGIDVSKPSINVYNPASFRLPASGAWSAMRFESGNPMVEARANGELTAWYRLDTGDPSTVTFHGPYIQREKLLDGLETSDITSAGVGGTVEAKAGKIKEFELGGHHFKNLDATFSLAKQGAFADMYVAGNIGQTLMTPFTMVLDYGNSRVAFLPK